MVPAKGKPWNQAIKKPLIEKRPNKKSFKTIISDKGGNAMAVDIVAYANKIFTDIKAVAGICTCNDGDNGCKEGAPTACCYEVCEELCLDSCMMPKGRQGEGCRYYKKN